MTVRFVLVEILLVALSAGCAHERSKPPNYSGPCGGPSECFTLALEKLEESRKALEAYATAEETLLGEIFPVGTIIPYHGDTKNNAALTAKGWWICDGRIVTDEKAPVWNGKATPNLTDRFVTGGITAGETGGSRSVEIPPQEIRSRTTGKWDDEHPLPDGHPDALMHRALSLTGGKPFYSVGTFPKTDVPFKPLYYRLVLLLKVR